jgi:superfamily I DNA and/or RNA helicase
MVKREPANDADDSILTVDPDSPVLKLPHKIIQTAPNTYDINIRETSWSRSFSSNVKKGTLSECKKRPLRQSPESKLISLQEYKKELFEDGYDNIHNQFTQENSDEELAVSHEDQATVNVPNTSENLNKSSSSEEDTSCVIIDDTDDDTDEDIFQDNFFKENEIILQNLQKTIQEVDLTGDYDDDTVDSDGFTNVPLTKTSPIVIKDRKVSQTTPKPTSKKLEINASPLVLASIKREKENYGSRSSSSSSSSSKASVSNASKNLMQSFLNKSKAPTPPPALPIQIATQTADEDSADDRVLSSFGARFEKDHKLLKIKKESRIEIEDANSTDSEVQLYLKSLKEEKKEIVKDSNLASMTAADKVGDAVSQNGVLTRIASDDEKCRVLIKALDSSTILKYTQQTPIKTTTFDYIVDDDNENFLELPKRTHKKLRRLSSDDDDDNGNDDLYDSETKNSENDQSYLKNIGRKISAKPPIGSGKKLSTKEAQYTSSEDDKRKKKSIYSRLNLLSSDESENEKQRYTMSIKRKDDTSSKRVTASDMTNLRTSPDNERNNLKGSFYREETKSSNDAKNHNALLDELGLGSISSNDDLHDEALSSLEENRVLKKKPPLPDSKGLETNGSSHNHKQVLQRKTIMVDQFGRPKADESPSTGYRSSSLATDRNKKRQAVSPEVYPPPSKRSHSAAPEREESSSSASSSKFNTVTHKKRTISNSSTSSSSSIIVEQIEFDNTVEIKKRKENPNLNSVDAEKKRYLDSNKIKTTYSTLATSNFSSKSSKAMEDLKNLKSRETHKLFADQKKKKTQNNDLNLTQVMRLAKFENATRLTTKIKEYDKSLNRHEKSPQPVIHKRIPPVTPQPPSLPPQPPQPPQPKPQPPQQPRPSHHSSITIAPIPSASTSKNHQLKPIASSSIKANSNDVVGNILNIMNENNAKPSVDKSNNSKKKVNSLQDFFCRIYKWQYIWLNEHEKNLSRNPNLIEGPSIIDNKELIMLTDSFTSYSDYYKSMFPLLLLETWEEMFKEQKRKLSNSRTYQNAPIWLRTVEKTDNIEVVKFIFQIAIDSFQQKTPMEDDLLGLTLTFGDPRNIQQMKSTRIFGNITAIHNNLKDEDPKVLEVARDHLKKNASGEHCKFRIVEFHVNSKNRLYQWNLGMTVDYEVITSLSSTVRRIKALLQFRTCSFREKILKPDSLDEVFRLDSNSVVNKCGDKEFKFEPANEMNESQLNVIKEASSIVSHNEAKLYFIQGPPGTGKSTTIVGILEAIFARIKWKHSLNGQPFHHSKILICSPSNSGCDELTRKIKNNKMAKNSNLKRVGNRDILIVRVGRTDSIHRDSDEFGLDFLTEKKCDELISKSQLEKSSSLKLQYDQFNKVIPVLEKKLKIAKQLPNVYASEIKEYTHQLDTVRKRKEIFENQLKRNLGVEAPSMRRKFKAQAKEIVLREADIIVSTLNYCGNSILDCLTSEKNKGKSLVDLIIVDEAAQSLEVESLIPLRFGCNKMIQVGDPEQLPATVLSKRAQENGLTRSLFGRIYQGFSYRDSNPIKMLYIQYRMHPEICIFPSTQFYRGKLITGKTNVVKTTGRAEPEPYLMYDLQKSHEEGDENSGGIFNPVEAEFVLNKCNELKTNFRNYNIGVITPYKRQVTYLKELFDKNRIQNIEIGTVDSYQGREKDIIIYSCVRAKGCTQTIGFLRDRQRLNVSLTRAKSAMYIVCHVDSLKEVTFRNDDWIKCIENAKKRNVIRKIS